MSSSALVLDDLALVAPFGVRFWDVTTMAPAGAGLTMIAFPTPHPDLPFAAIEGPGGAYSFANLPGIRRFENGLGDDAFWSANPPSIAYTVNVSDAQARYLAFRFFVQLPFRGFYGLLASPMLPALTPDATWLPVFSTPSRVVSGPGAVIRAQLQDDRPGAHPPPAWAMVIAQFPGLPPVTGVADERGIVTITIPYPEPANSPFGSLPASGALKLFDQTWAVNIAVRYSGTIDPKASPDLEDVLQQGLGAAWTDGTHSTTASTFTVAYGSDLILRSRDSVSGRALPVLLVTPAP